MRANIVSRVSRLSYGIIIMEPFDAARHREEDKQYVASVDGDFAVNQMYWYLRKNQDIRDQEVHRIPWKRIFRGPLPGNRMSIGKYSPNLESRAFAMTFEKHRTPLSTCRLISLTAFVCSTDEKRGRQPTSKEEWRCRDRVHHLL